MELKNLHNEAAKLRMTPDEKSAMKARIFGAPAPVQMTPAQSPYYFFSFQFIQTRVLAPAFAILVIFVGSGTVAAAQGALPGDFLYPVKVSINETVELALATTPVAKAEVSAKLAERRVEEAQALAAQGELTPSVGEALAANFEVYADEAQLAASEVDAQDPSAAAELRAALSSRLAAHGVILATLSLGEATQNTDAASAVAAKVVARTVASANPAFAPATMRVAKMAEPAATEPAMMMTMSMVAQDTATTVSLEADMPENSVDEDAERATTKAQVRAEAALVAARKQFDTDKKDLPQSTVTRVSGEVVAIEGLMEQGSTTLLRRDYIQAQDNYAEAYRRSVQLSVLLKAQATLERNIIDAILEANASADAAVEVTPPAPAVDLD
jgi:hypothetical protein